MSEPGVSHRAGFAALLGPPNAGKSTLLNRLLGEKLAIVTAKPQTTRSRILGIVTRPGSQILLLDTPGLHAATRPLSARMNESVAEVARECDVGVLVVDACRGWEPSHDVLLATLRARGIPVVVAWNKLDAAGAETKDPVLPAAAGEACVVRVSGHTGAGIGALLAAIETRLPESPPLYPEDELTDRPLRWLCAELIREAAFEQLDAEIPYGLAVEVLRFDESRPDGVALEANLLVARESQKRIVVGAGGRMVKAIGMRARKQIERLVGRRAHLRLFVKVDPRWSQSPRRMDELGYR